jgi:uncharacterized phage protein gp47/JayE
MTFGLTPNGFNQKRLADIVTDLNNAFIAQFGDINTTPQSVFGQVIGIMAKMYADIWEDLTDVYFSQYPNSAAGPSLDNVVQLNGLVRMAQSQTEVFASCVGNEGTFIPPNSLAKIPNSNSVFFTPNGGFITRANADLINVSVLATAAQVYTVQMNSVSFIYSLPIVTFTGSFVTSNSIVVNLNGINLAAVPFNTSSAQTLTDIATKIATDPAVFSATAAGSAISIVPNLGFSVTINFISITGGASQPTYAITFAVPATLDTISSYLVAVLNANTPTWTATDSTGTFSIMTNSEESPFSINVGSNLSITFVSSPITFLSQEYGPVACPVNSLTLIQTPVGGWESITNVAAGLPGQFTETDAQLRLRRQNSIKLLGLGTVDAIEAHLSNISGVDSAIVYENISLTETDLVITFSDVISSGQTINVSYNGGAGSFTVAFITDQNTTMAALQTAFQALVFVSSTALSGVNNTTITVSMNVLQQLTIITGDVTVTGSGTLPTAIVDGGQPSKSIQCVVDGGLQQDIGNEIWLSKPAGIETFGNTQITVIDSQGNDQFINFQRPTEIFIWVKAVLTLYPEETFPANGNVDVANAILNYGQSLGIGFDVLWQRVLSQIFTVPGIASAVLTIAATPSINTAPIFSAADISISASQIGNFNIQRITVA